MNFRMVNSNTSFGSERNGQTKASYMQEAGLHQTSSSPLTASSATQSKNILLGADHSPKLKTTAGQWKPPETKFTDLTADDSNDVLPDSRNNSDTHGTKTTLICSFPLEKVQTILAKYASFTSNCNKMKVTRKILCLYCDRTFANAILRQKHVERCHSAKHLRRASLRKHQNILTSTPCIFCDQFTSTEHTLKDLFKHLVQNHSNKYFGCIPCEIRFLNFSNLADHNLVCPNITRTDESTQDCPQALATFKSLPISLKEFENRDNSSVKMLRKKQKTKKDDSNVIQGSSSEDQRKCDVKTLRSKKLSVKSSRMILKRSKRLQAKLSETVKKKRTRDLNEKKKSDRLETLTEKSTKVASTFVNPYPEFDHFFQVKKITDHSIDNLKISSLTFDDVFDKAFFNRIRCNIQENLMHHIDGKLFKNEESESRISNFEKNANIPQETQNLNSENYGCELSLNAIAPTTMLLSNQLGDDPESQIEYGSKPSKKKTQLKKDEVHYKYFTRRKYQASILEHKENRDLSKLDMWTQYVIKRRQQKIQDDKRTPKEILDYFASEEYKNMLRREELNRILDRRGPFEDLKEEVSKKAALDKLNGDSVHTSDDNFTEIGELLNDILNRVFELSTESSVPLPSKNPSHHLEDASEIPSYLNLRPSTDVIPENEIDKSDKIALICSSQETENFELPSNTVRGKNEKVELTGEWARSRIYVCAACGLKLQNIKQFLEHKSATHQYIWVQHYEFVGNQSELYRHLSIPVLGKVGVLENGVQCKVWRRSDARLCTKCGKQCNSLGELHRHILECGGDWTWMLARKKCKYRPFGAKSRRKRKGLVKRIHVQKSEVSSAEKKTYKKTYDLPRQKPSDADTIKRMLANLPPKRATRKIISLNPPRTRQVQTTKQSKFKCGKLLRQKAKEATSAVKNEFKNGKKTHNGNYRRSLRCLSKVLTSRILDTKSTLIVRRKLKNEQEKKRNLQQQKQNEKENISTVAPKKVPRAKKNKAILADDKTKESELKTKRSSPRKEKRLDAKTGSDKLGIKRFFPVKKKQKTAVIENVKKNDVTKVATVPENNKLETNVAEVGKVENGSVNLRKRKSGRDVGPNTPKKAKVRKRGKAVKTGKLRSSPRSIVSELNLQANSEPPQDNNIEKSDFFGEILTQDATDPLDVKLTDVVDCVGHEKTEVCVDHEKTEKVCVDHEKTEEVCVDHEKTEVCVSHEETEDVCAVHEKTEDVCAVQENTEDVCVDHEKTEAVCVDHEKTEDVCAVQEKTEDVCVDHEKTEDVCVDYEKTEDVCAGHEETKDASEEIEKIDESTVHISKSDPEKVVDTCGKNESITNDSVSSQNKRKLKKPVRGLNDCIAMLTSKLGKSFEESATDNIFNSGAPNQVACDTNRKAEYLLKVPFSNEHFHLRINHDETDIKMDDCALPNADLLLQTSDSSETGTSDVVGNEDSHEFDDEQAHGEDLVEEEEEEKLEEQVYIPEQTIVEDLCLKIIENDINYDYSGEQNKELAAIENEEVFAQLEKITNDINWDSSISNELDSSDSEDEIPLSTFLKNDIQETLITSSISLKDNNDAQMPSDSETNIETDVDSSNLNKLSFEAFEKNLRQNEEKLILEGDVKLMKKKDVAVLTEINANFCEHTENIPINFENSSNKLEPINRRIHEIKVDDSLLTNSDLLLQKGDSDEKFDPINDAKDISDLVSLEKYCEQQILSKLDKFNFFTKSSFEADATSNVTIYEHLSVTESNVDDSKKLEGDTSEYKENVIRKHKQKKKTLFNRVVNKTKGENHRKGALSEGSIDGKKASKNEKTLEPKSDECLIDLTETELIVEDVTKSDVKETDDLIFKPEEALEIEEKQMKVVGIDDGSTNGGSCEEILENQSLSNLIELSDQTVKLLEDSTENVKELRRSSRNSRRITSYNETDMIDPLLDDLESDRTISRIIRETTKDIFGFRRKKGTKKLTKNGHIEKKLNGDELFDLLKSAPTEHIVLSKPANAYFNTFDEISNEFNDDNFDVFEDILEKSIAVIDENLSQPVELTTDEIVGSIPVNQNYDEANPKPQNKKKVLKKKGKNQKHKNKHKQKLEYSKDLNDEIKSGDIDYVLNSGSVDGSDMNAKDADRDVKSDKSKIYCEICEKSFSRVESLTKHKRTLTHISKLSELEAKEAALKTKCDPKSTNEENETTAMSHCRKDLNLLDMLASVDEEECKQCPPFDVDVRNSNLKLADIINDVLNKPMSKKDDDTPNFAEVIDKTQVEVRRCKSLAERKSFESESFKNVDYFNPEISNVAAGTILEKQITLLENIIENRSTVNYIDEISECSSPSIDKSSECQIESVDSKRIDSVAADAKEAKSEEQEGFLKPSQYEEISEDSNLRNYDEQKSRKALNRDEELFLECCSLLKSGSEVSSYSKKSNNISKDVNKPCDESDWMETNYLSQQGNSNFAECYSDSSRIRTPLGDSFSQDSNSATLSSQWNMNNSCTPTKKQIWKEDLKLKNKNLTFEEVFCTKDENIYCKDDDDDDGDDDDDDNLDDLHSMVSSFDRVISEVLNTELHPTSENTIKRCVSNTQELPRDSFDNNEHKESTSADGRKVLTKGAMKIFEGLKVSIPTEDLNIDKILISGSPIKASSFNGCDASEEVKTAKSNCRVQNKLSSKKPTKCMKPLSSKKQNHQQGNSKVHDVYDFEETQDNSDVFTKPDFRTFRNHSEKCRKPDQEGSDDDSQDCTDPFSLDAMSSSTSSVSEVLPVKSSDQQNLTKKKCMIMGRIFKNVVVKSKVVDEDIRNIPVIDNTKLVENFVLNCPQPEVAAAAVTAKKPRMTEEEMNLEFDKLISKQNESKQTGGKSCSSKNSASKRKQKTRNKKRSHCNSDSSDDEYKLQKHSIKRTKKKNTNAEKESCINLEQELRECIGVASRKSQRKCTSGKQNVLIEYWSSDESSFEALLEKQIVNSVPQNLPIHHEERSDHFAPTTHAEVKICSNESANNESTTHHQSYDVEVISKKPSSRSNRRKRAAANPLYHWSSSSEDESRDLIEIRPLRDEAEDDDRPIQHGWIVGDSPKKLVTMLAQAKGKKIDIGSVKEHGRKRPSVCS